MTLEHGRSDIMSDITYISLKPFDKHFMSEFTCIIHLDHRRNDLMSDITYIIVKHLMSGFTWTMSLDHGRTDLISDITYIIVLNSLTSTLCLNLHRLCP